MENITPYKLVIDIETSNSFADVGGHKNLAQLNTSFVGVYSYNKNEYLSFYEDGLEKLGPLLQKAGLVIGFALNRFDIPVLDKHFSFNLFALPRLDILEEIELSSGIRISLNILAKANLGIGKTGHGLEAITLYKEGRLQELRDYCLMDVRLTKELYDLVKRQGYLIIPDKITDEPQKIALSFKDAEMPSKLF